LRNALPVNADPQITQIGSVVFLIDADDRKPIYTFSFEFGTPRLSVASPLTENHICDASTVISKIIRDRALERSASLLVTSLNQATDQTQAYIAAWSALEIFVNATFKARYEASWFDIMEKGAPPSAKPIVERFRHVMGDKYRLADKFLIIASVLNSEAADADAIEFKRLKRIRDDFYHAPETPLNLPTEAIQKLLIKYMNLYLAQ
jgi:hypothetical protein